MSSSLLAVRLLAVALGAAPVAPVVVIEHHGPVVLPDGVGLEARMVSTVGRKVFEPAAFVRPVGEAEFTRLPLSPMPDDRYRAALPPALAGKDCEYFLEAFDEDGNGPFRKGGPDRPIRLTKPTAQPAPHPAQPKQPTAKLEEPARKGRPLRAAGIGLVAGGAALVVAGAVCGGLALKDFETEKATTDPAVYASSKSAAKAEALAADVLLGAGAVAAIVGVILWANDPNPAPAKAVTVGATPIAGGACATLSGRF